MEIKNDFLKMGLVFGAILLMLLAMWYLRIGKAGSLLTPKVVEQKGFVVPKATSSGATK